VSEESVVQFEESSSTVEAGAEDRVVAADSSASSFPSAIRNDGEAVVDSSPLDELVKELENAANTNVSFAFEIVAMMTKRGIATTALGQLRAALTNTNKNARVRALVLSECVAIVAQAELLKRLSAESRSSESQSPVEPLTPVAICASFLNELCGFAGSASDSLWRDTLCLRMLQNFAHLFTPEEQASHVLVQQHVLMFQILRSLLTHRTGLVLSADALAAVLKCTPLGHDRSHETQVSDAENYRLKEADITAASALRLAQIVDVADGGKSPAVAAVDWTAMILLVDDESDRERINQIVKHGEVMRNSIGGRGDDDAASAATLPQPREEQQASDAAARHDEDDWIVLREAQAVRSDDNDGKPSNKSPKLESLKSKMTGFKLSLLGVLNNSFK
jgi:hypothetical protein